MSGKNTFGIMATALMLALGGALSSARGASPEGESGRAQQLVSTRCALCHGMQGQSVSTQFPKLSGQNAEYLVKQLFNFKTGQRPSTVMEQMANDLTATDIHLLANYFAGQTMQLDRVEDPELAVIGRYIYFRGNRWSAVSACVTCHGVYARGGAQLPRLSGQHASYIETRLRVVPTAGARTTLGIMHSSIAAITELETKAVAQYLSGEE